MLAQLLRRLLALLLVQRRIRVWFGLTTTSWHMMARRRRALPAELIFEVLGASRCEKWRQLSDAGAQRQEAAAATGPTGSSVERLARALAAKSAIRIFYAQLANFAGQHTKEAREERKRFRRWFDKLHHDRVISGDLWECVKEGEAPLFFSDGHLRCGRYNGTLQVAFAPDRFIGAGYLVVFQHAILFLSRENNDNGFSIRRQFVLGTEVAEVSVRKTDLSTFVFTAQPKRSSRRRFWPPSSTQSKSAEVSFMVTDPELDPRFLAGTLHDVKRLNFVGNDDDERCTGRFLCLQLCRLRQRWERMESECAKQADLLFASQLRALEAVADSASEQSLNVQEQRLRDKALELGGQRTWVIVDQMLQRRAELRQAISEEFLGAHNGLTVVAQEKANEFLNVVVDLELSTQQKDEAVVTLTRQLTKNMRRTLNLSKNAAEVKRLIRMLHAFILISI